MDKLIYDRTKADVNRATALDTKMARGTALADERAEWMAGMKGSWNIADLNRIEEATVQLRDLLLGHGYHVSVATRRWTAADMPGQAEIDRMRRNIDALQAGFYSLPDWREIVYNNTIDFAQANALEWDLYAIGVWVTRMVAAFVYSGEVYAGELI